MSETLRIVIAEDERLARERLIRLLGQIPGTEIVGIATHGDAAVDAIVELRPDVVMLDIHMPRLDGFEVLAAIQEIEWPQVIFTTAWDRYAVRAFEVQAADYLLKPFGMQRVAAAIARARGLRAAGRREVSRPTRSVLGGVRREHGWIERLVVRRPGRIAFLDLQEVEWIEAADNYVYLHTETERHLVRGTLKELSQRLDPARFARVHRRAVVNLNRLAAVSFDGHGDATIILRSGARVDGSRRYAKALRARTLG